MASMKYPAKPKKPKISAPITAWERYDQRMKDWEKRKKEIDAAKKKKAALIKKHAS